MTKTEQVLKLFTKRRHIGVTSIDAIKNCWAIQLPDVVRKLKRQGHMFRDTFETNRKTGSRYKRYFLVS